MRPLLMWLAGAALAGPPAFDPAPGWESYATTLRATYAYLDRDPAEVDVEGLLGRLRTAALATQSAPELRRVLHRGSLALADPHVLVAPLDDDDPNVWPTSADLVVDPGPGGQGLVIGDVRRDSAAAAAGLQAGAPLLAVEGVPIDQAVAAFWGALVPAPTPTQRAFAATLLANGRRTGPRELTVGAPPRRLTLDNPRALARAVSARPPLTVRTVAGVCVLRPENSLGDLALVAAVDTALAGCDHAQGLVLDLRNTPSGGNTDVARGILGHFTDETASYQIHEIPAVARRTGVPRRFVEQVLPRAPRVGGPVVVLAGAWTGSMGEGLVIGMDALGAHTVARDMGDLLGALHSFPLEGGAGTLELGAEALFHVDGRPRADFVAATPRSAVEAGPAGDPALELALAHIAAARP